MVVSIWPADREERSWLVRRGHGGQQRGMPRLGGKTHCDGNCRLVSSPEPSPSSRNKAELKGLAPSARRFIDPLDRYGHGRRATLQMLLGPGPRGPLTPMLPIASSLCPPGFSRDCPSPQIRREGFVNTFCRADRQPLPCERLEVARTATPRASSNKVRIAGRNPLRSLGWDVVFPEHAQSGSLLGSCSAKGRDAISTIPAERFDCDRYFRPASAPHTAGKMYTRHGGFIEGFDQFDPHVFRHRAPAKLPAWIHAARHVARGRLGSTGERWPGALPAWKALPPSGCSSGVSTYDYLQA